ncbi:MAG: penicillin-binding protein 2 [Lactobacillales bacterium]|jgi:cell division protein FtsI (penicillin-binding protein 3)|nr:penicillin-binding protein 2 [Lactobacillales bacterium]
MFFIRKKETFYYPGIEIPQTSMDKYRCLDYATLGALQKAKARTTLLMLVFGLSFFIIIARLFQLTVINYQERAFRAPILKTATGLVRKNMTDRQGNIIATALPTVHLSVNPSLVKNPEEVALNLSQVLPGATYEDMLSVLTAPGYFKYVRRNLTPKERNDVNWLGYHFLTEADGEKRVYPQGSLFAHIIGAVDIDNQGIAGLEKSYEDQIKQNDLVLSLDLPLQEMTRSALAAGIAKYGADGGIALVMNVNNGEVLATVSLPDFNPNLPRDGDQDKYFNKAVSGIYEFGSVFKLFNTAMALEYGDIKPTDVYDASQPLKIGKKVIEDYRGQNRPLTVTEILIHSSNIGTVKIAEKSGYQKQKEFLKKFGFFERLPLHLPEKATPQYPAGAKWPDITSATAAFGYGISVTPMHLAAGVAALVNGGIYHVPTFVKGENDKTVEYQIISEKNSETLRHMMWAVMNWDSKPDSIESKYGVGGKTGSANLIEDGKYVKGALRTTFVGVFPMNDPQYVVLVTLENPKKRKEDFMFNTGGWNAKPVAMDIISRIAPYLGVHSVPENWAHPAYITHAIDTSKKYKKR